MSKVKIRWSNQALENLTDIVQYWEGISPRHARAVGRAIMDKINLLADFPNLGKPIEGLPSAYRETFADNYRILYKRIEDTHTLLITIQYGKQRPPSPDEIADFTGKIETTGNSAVNHGPNPRAHPSANHANRHESDSRSFA